MTKKLITTLDLLLAGACLVMVLAFLSRGSQQESIDRTVASRPVLPPDPLETGHQIDLGGADFPRGEWIDRQVRFWVTIYTRYFYNQILIHDVEEPSRVYEVLDVGHLTDEEAAALVRRSRTRWQRFLERLHEIQLQINAGADLDQVMQKMTDDQRRVFFMFQDEHHPLKFRMASRSGRIRLQRGLRDRFIEAIRRSGRYLPMIERTFEFEGIPIEISRLPLVESGFDPKVVSHVGASGIWQLMSYTAKRYIRINRVIDERNDPVKATFAAAQLLRHNYEALKSWPLAIVAYNHGKNGLLRAIRRLKTRDPEIILKSYRGRAFRFASRNFYPSFLAALEVERNSDVYYGEIIRDRPISYHEFVVPARTNLPALIQQLEVARDGIEELNPGLTLETLQGERHLPVGFRLRVPAEQKYDSNVSL